MPGTMIVPCANPRCKNKTLALKPGSVCLPCLLKRGVRKHAAAPLARASRGRAVIHTCLGCGYVMGRKDSLCKECRGAIVAAGECFDCGAPLAEMPKGSLRCAACRAVWTNKLCLSLQRKMETRASGKGKR